MLTLLNSPGFRSRAMPLSVAAWHGMIASNLAPDRAELIRGVIVEKMSKSIIHTKLAARLLSLLLALCPPKLWVRKEEPLTLADSEPEPDISIVAGVEADYVAHPSTALLVIEVAVSSMADDRELASLYAEAGVPEYWIINGREHCIEVYRSPADGSYQQRSIHGLGATLQSVAVPDFAITTSSLFEGIPPSA